MRPALKARVLALIAQRAEHEDRDARDALLRDLLRFQRDGVAAYGRLVAQLANTERDPLRWPALPTDVFRFARVAAHDPSLDVRVFRTSGTGSELRGSHALCDLTLYDAAAERAARDALFPDVARMRLVILASSGSEQPDSSLSYMLDRFTDWFGTNESVHVVRAGELDRDALSHALSDATRAGEPVALLGTSFAFVHAEDALGARRFALPRGSRLMQTGGFKGRSREVSSIELLTSLSARYGVPESFIVQEYGMTELCSQLYETTLREAVLGLAPGPRRFRLPAWVRATVVDPATFEAVPPGREGLLRIDDPCNLDSACAIQTSDRAVWVGAGLHVLGRAPAAVARGCSIATDVALSRA